MNITAGPSETKMIQISINHPLSRTSETSIIISSALRLRNARITVMSRPVTYRNPKSQCQDIDLPESSHGSRNKDRTGTAVIAADETCQSRDQVYDGK